MTHTIHYTILPLDPYAHVFAVSCKVENPNPNGQSFYLPVWTPGSYKIRDFAKQVSHVHAQASGEPLDCYKTDKNTWQCAPTTQPITIFYRVYAWDLSVRGAHLDQTHATINGTSVFFCPIGAENDPCVVDIERPTGDAYKSWRVGTALTRGDTFAYEFGRYHAKNYAELIDHPIELGDFVVTTFTEQGIPHELIFSGLAPNTDIERITQDIQRICAYYLTFFPKPHPMERYVFLIMLLDQGFGGLEHRASSYLHFSKYGLPTSGNKTVSEVYSTFLTLCSHEYLHTWLVKGIKPKVFMPYDLYRENYTEQLWVFEGFTAYYEDLILVRNGLLTEKQFFILLAQKITRLWRSPGRYVQSVAQASFDAWIKFYQPDEHTANITVSYYLKGALIALVLDIYLREHTDNRKSLDTILLELWQRYASTAQGVAEDALMVLIQEQLGGALDQLMQQLIYTTDELPLTDVLAKIGIHLQPRPAKNPQDKGDVMDMAIMPTAPAVFERSEPIPVDLGIVFDPRVATLTILQCLTDGAAKQAGLSAGDVIIAIDKLRVDATSLSMHLARYAPGDTITVDAFRRDLLMSFTVTLQEAMPVPVLTIQYDNSEKVQRRNAWLRGTGKEREAIISLQAM